MVSRAALAWSVVVGVLGISPACLRPAPAAEKSFVGQFQVGQRVALADASGGGVYVILGGPQNLPWIQFDNDERLVADAEHRYQTLATLLQEMVRANEKVPNSFSRFEVGNTRHQVGQAEDQLRAARRRSQRPDVWEVAAVGSDYIELRARESQMTLPLSAVQAILRNTAAGDAAPAAGSGVEGPASRQAGPAGSQARPPSPAASQTR